MSKKSLSQEQAKARAISVWGDLYDFSEFIYTGSRENVKVKCAIHGIFERPYKMLVAKKKGCRTCIKENKVNNGVRLTLEEFVRRSVIVHNIKYDYSFINEYKNVETKVPIKCPFHGIFWQSPHVHMDGQGCDDCGHISSGMKQRLTKEQFLQKAKEIHGDTYDYSQIIYTVQREKVIIICGLHGPFPQAPSDHIYDANGCPTCAGNKRLTLAEFLINAYAVHGDEYDYSFVGDDIRSKRDVKIVCRQHGPYTQMPYVHTTRGQGCAECGRLSKYLTTDEFIAKAKSIHYNTYDYSLVEYTHSNHPVKIICKKHGLFLQSAHGHLTGYGCSLCVRTVSLAETSWLDHLMIPNEWRQKSIRINDKLYRLDAYDHHTNTAYEFDGDFWHGNPAVFDPNDENVMCYKTFGELHTKTMMKKSAILNAGYNLISIWENDWTPQWCELRKQHLANLKTKSTIN
jgi:hypothetical protein